MKLFIKAVAAVLVLALSACTGVLTVFAELSDDAETPTAASCYKGAFYYRSGERLFFDTDDSEDYYVYSDDYFRSPSSEYNIHLATMSMAVSEASAGSSREPLTDEGYARRCRNIIAILEDIGFSDIAVNDDYRSEPTKDSVGVACAHKRIVDGGRSYTLLAVVPRSSGYGAELGGNFLFGARGNASGFNAACEKALSFTRRYISDNGLKGDIKLWTVGYDRGAGIVNLISKKLIDDPVKSLGSAVTLSPDNLYAYTFGTPCAADKSQDTGNERYSAVYNHISDSDITSVIPQPEMGFDRYGTVKIINSEEKKASMKHLLAICSRDIYTDYVRNSDPDLFTPKRITASSFSTVDDKDSYIPADAREYIRGMSVYLNQISGGRAGYAADVEKPLSLIAAYYGGLTGAQADAFDEVILNHKDTVNCIFSMYAYFMKLKSSGTASTSAQEELADTAALSDYETEFTEKELLDILMRMVGYMSSSPDTILSDSADYLKNVLTSALKETGASNAQISNLTTEKNLKALSHFLAFLLFGNIWQSDETDVYNVFDNEQIKNVVTLLGNAQLLLSDHKNELQISWLRTDDSYYNDYARMTAAQSAGYRRVYLNASDGARINGTVYNSAGEKAADIADGVLVNSSDSWLGYTSADDGGFLRVPADDSYRIELTADTPCSLDIAVREYECDTAEAKTVLTQTCDVTAKTVVTVELPSPAEGHTIPSGAEYSVTTEIREPLRLSGDADGDGEVTVLDATAIQRYCVKTDTDIIEDLADVDGDGEITVTDATFIQRWVINLPCPYDIGESVKQ